MPEADIHILSAIQTLDARPEDTAHGFRTQEGDVKNRLNTLFQSEGAAEAGEKQIDEDGFEKEQKLDYETVNEGMTTDTTEASGQTRRGIDLSESADPIEANTQKEPEAV
jgi:hypothetical protein